MEGKASSSRGKRKFPDDDDADDNKPPVQKKPRFPKGKKVKEEKVVVAVVSGPQEAPTKDLHDPKAASKERSKKRTQIQTQSFTAEDVELVANISDAEERRSEDDGNFVEDGVQMEPFNLDQEREEGYFDEDGNFVEYKNENEKDAWLDSVEVNTRFAGGSSNMEQDDETNNALSAEDIARIKRRIANLLQPGETVLKALRRLKGTGNDKKEKMSEETKKLFDQLTEDSMKLMDNGEYDVYHDRQETFEREAEGYEKLAAGALDMFSADDENLIGNRSSGVKDMFSDSAAPADDMFAEDDEDPNLGQASTILNSGSIADLQAQPSTETVDTTSNGNLENDYVYDESSGYYYSSTLGYYYDPATTLYCCATSGRWYSYNENTGAYDEFQGESTDPVS